jgi:hypothetical protein
MIDWLLQILRMLGDTLSFLQMLGIHSGDAHNNSSSQEGNGKKEAVKDDQEDIMDQQGEPEREKCSTRTQEDDVPHVVRKGDQESGSSSSFVRNIKCDSMHQGQAGAGEDSACNGHSDSNMDIDTAAASTASTHVVEGFAELIAQLAGIDDEGIFKDPVPLDKYPDYAKCIPSPMDFSSMLMKQKQGAYALPEQLALDFLLICANAVAYNHHSMHVHIKALCLLAQGLPLLLPLVPPVAVYHVAATVGTRDQARKKGHEGGVQASSSSSSSGAKRADTTKSMARAKAEADGRGVSHEADLEHARSQRQSKGIPLYNDRAQTREMREFLSKVRCCYTRFQGVACACAHRIALAS